MRETQIRRCMLEQGEWADVNEKERQGKGRKCPSNHHKKKQREGEGHQVVSKARGCAKKGRRQQHKIITS